MLRCLTAPDKNSKHNLAPLILCIACVMINLLFNYLISKVKLPTPLYLDTIGTVLAAVLGGTLPGVLVGFITNFVLSFSTPSSLYYGVINVIIAVAASFLAERKKLKKPSGLIALALSLTIISGILGAVIPWYMEGLSLDSASLSGEINKIGIFGPFVSYLISNTTTNLLDKTLTVIIALLLYRLIPEKFSSMFRFTGWQQTPTRSEEVINKDRTENRAVSMRIKMLIVLMIALSTVAAAGTYISVRVYYKSMINQHTAIAQGTAKLAAKELDGDKIAGYLESGGDSEDYRESEQLLEDILYSSPEIAYLYVYRMEPDGFHVVFDIETDDIPADEIGSILPYDNGFEPYLDKLLSGESVEPIITNDEYGHLLTAAEPVYNSAGECQCYAIADVDVKMLIKDKHSFLTEMISVFTSILIIICAFVIWMTDYNIIFPLRSITMQIDKISRSGDDQESLDNDVKKIRKLKIHTGDEIEQLYQSLCTMTLNQSEQMRSIRRLSDSTVKMQDGLIITMADMVENRDSDTGAHIQKTSAYVKIIVESLKQKGYYAEKITPKFMSDVVRSAPLHDVGKINIPDGVLNKPGKLTPEEYEIMKTHTTAGKKIMEHAIETVEGDSYLKEARNMAAYHHERWDGKGYPEGLHGEVIPLSARIMSVADVFDALTSPRVYKPAFPLDKALSIIKEGNGTQFDPKCVEAFMDSLDEVKKVLRKYNQA
ncbi:MAG: HD domain-containing protein [Ruminococcus sp.]|uniref:HD domain-containing phosphohydrolase n=1 Tax=Ruminococcus sp. TaxID=41978 RepID=UPI0025D8389D|nr:HD domain-containing phosphohydrolase [Ruminococcus sp.]MCR5540515.1 HD domain-containing protein [Ruminococcus sp.]